MRSPNIKIILKDIREEKQMRDKKKLETADTLRERERESNNLMEIIKKKT